MKTIPVLASLLLGVLAPVLAGAEPPTRQEIVPSGHLESVVQVRDVLVSPTELSGTLVNLTDHELRDIRLRASDVFLWRNETRPGTDDPSRSEELVVKGPIPPRGALQFTAPRTPLPDRDDGDFTTRIEVTSLTQQPVTAQAAPPPVTTTVAP